MSGSYGLKVSDLAKMGVRRISVGSSLALAAPKKAASPDSTAQFPTSSTISSGNGNAGGLAAGARSVQSHIKKKF
jgi:hypothetical protein